METPNIILVNQKVKDIKVAPNPDLENAMGRFRYWLRRHAFIPGDKVPATVTPTHISNGVMVADISGAMLSSDLDTSVHIRQHFPLPLPDYNGPMDVESIFASVPGTRIDDGGNVQNMAVNVALALQCASAHSACRKCRAPLRLTVASSSDPFCRMDAAEADALRRVCHIYPLDLPDRFAIQVPWRAGDESGTLAITSEPQRTGEALRHLAETNVDFRRTMESATCIVSSDPVYDQLAYIAKPPYSYLINSSTAFRTLVAAESYGRTAILPMNNDEASDVCKLLLQRGLEEELGKIDRPPFPPPLASSGDAIDADALCQLDQSVEMLSRYIFLYKNPGRVSFTCPITFGPHGGMLIGTDHENIACFTSTPSPEGEDSLLREFADIEPGNRDRKHEVGAGDSVAAIVALFNAVDPSLFLVQHMQGREESDRQLRQLASTVFVSILGRIAGNFLIRTVRTYWGNVRKDSFPALLDEAAKESLSVARLVIRKLQAPVIVEVKKWGIHVVIWRPGFVAYPNRDM
jgi:hypothetical protein